MRNKLSDKNLITPTVDVASFSFRKIFNYKDIIYFDSHVVNNQVNYLFEVFKDKIG